jgi:hypothetical protein
LAYANQAPVWVSEIAMRNIVSMASGTLNDQELFESLRALCEQSPLDRDICEIEASLDSQIPRLQESLHSASLIGELISLDHFLSCQSS